jgi:hypothetical protein
MGNDESSGTSEESPRKSERRSARTRGGGDHLCARCGELLGREEMELHARRKKSQLEKFGLAGARRLLRKRKP